MLPPGRSPLSFFTSPGPRRPPGGVRAHLSRSGPTQAGAWTSQTAGARSTRPASPTCAAGTEPPWTSPKHTSRSTPTKPSALARTGQTSPPLAKQLAGRRHRGGQRLKASGPRGDVASTQAAYAQALKGHGPPSAESLLKPASCQAGGGAEQRGHNLRTPCPTRRARARTEGSASPRRRGASDPPSRSGCTGCSRSTWIASPPQLPAHPA